MGVVVDLVIFAVFALQLLFLAAIVASVAVQFPANSLAMLERLQDSIPGCLKSIRG